MKTMNRTTMFVALAVLVAVSPALALAQEGFGRGEMGERGERGYDRRGEFKAPDLPGSELDGPPDSATIAPVLNLTLQQAARYVAARDSFMAATRVERDSARALERLMYAKLDQGDRGAAMFYVEPLQKLGKDLKQRQDKFEDQLHDFLSGDQIKAYQDWRKQQDKAAEDQAKRDAERWRTAGFGGGGGGPALEAKTFLNARGLPQPDAGSQAVRIGRTVYVASQIALDDAGRLVGGSDLHAQAVQAFTNLLRVLGAAKVLPEDVVRLTICVVNYSPDDLATIREAGAAYFAARNPPVITVLGVQSLARAGALISVEATAVHGNSFQPPDSTRREQ
jgi:enamine deaminase RidA (YjgF/YER057c/UK114 family)